jgi:hypothetical protein
VGNIVTGYIQGDMTLDRESVRQLQVAATTAHVFIYFLADWFTRLLCADCFKTKKAGDPGSATHHKAGLPRIGRDHAFNI